MEVLPSIFEPGKNCWRSSPASKIAVLVDASDYFSALEETFKRAQRSIFILSWDIDSRMSLIPGKNAVSLADLFLQLVEDRPQLEIYILSWDFLFIYADEREKKAETKKRFCRHPRIHFVYDKTGPILISHHQKVVVVDNELAFCGGLDITQRRWDLSDHAIENPLRKDPTGKSYGPFHDVQMMVEGEVARDLGMLFRERWFRRTGQYPLQEISRSFSFSLWPSKFEPLISNHAVSIARTDPGWKGRDSIRECETLFLDFLRHAKKYIYIENQYLTSRKIGNAIAERLGEDDPPEIVLLVRLRNSKWTEALSVAVLRARLLRRLLRADKHGKLLVACPYASVEKNIATNLHSKVFIADDKWLRVGSANLCGRSIAMDTECDLAIEAQTSEEQRAIRYMRNRLLAEHIGTTEMELEREFLKHNSLLATIHALHDKRDKTIKACPHRSHLLLEWIVPSASLVDPETPREFLYALLRTAVYGAVLAGVLLILPSLFTMLKPSDIVPIAKWVQSQPFATIGLTALFAFLASIPLPLLPLALAYALLLPPWQTFICTLFGALGSAFLGYVLARNWIRRSQIHWISRLRESERFLQMQQILVREGIWPLLLTRLVPVAPFWLENICMGVVGVKFSHYFLATLLGLLPGFTMVAFFDKQLSSGEGGLRTVILFIVLFVLMGWVLQKGVRHFVERRALDANSGEL